jgi:two-component system, OmpR family, sensor histidine kinase PhoQ
MRTRSLNARLLVSVSILLVLFFGVTIVVLYKVYRDLSDNAIRTRLELQVSVLISASDEQSDQKLAPGETLNQARFAHLGSGLYGEIDRDDGEVMWRSASLTGTGLHLAAKMPPGKRRTHFLKKRNGADVQALSVGLEWEFPQRNTRQFTYTVAEDLAPYRADLQSFREQLIGWFSGLMLVLLASLAVLFRWVLKPLRNIEHEIEEIEAGSKSELGEGYPRELIGVTTNMNTLLRSERERLARYRNTLGNLAHSLKTPLAVIRSLADNPQLQEQITRMDDIVSYQLKRAAMSGGTGLGTAPIEVASVIEALRETLQKVYAEKRVNIELQIDSTSRFIGDRGDLMEIVGNVLDNACKWCRSRVRVTAQPLGQRSMRRAGLLLIVEDDGPGIASDQRDHVLKRGARLDERVSGQGIGLSVVQELAQLAGGNVEIGESSLGGAKITVRLQAV